MQNFSLQQTRKRLRRLHLYSADLLLLMENLPKERSPVRVKVIWVAGFTQLTYKSRMLYLATVADALTREVSIDVLDFLYA